MRQPRGLRLIAPGTAHKLPSRRFGEYTLLRKIGEGGMATVYLAEAVDERADLVRAAIKLMKSATVQGVDVGELFAQEADVHGLLRHPNLVELYEVGKEQGQWFMALEFCPGGDLEALMDALAEQGQRMPPSAALEIGIDLLKALAYLHQAQGVTGTSLELVHGDINPGNVFFTLRPGRAKLADLGVVSSAALGGGLPEGMAAGKLHYLSPEQIQGKPLTGSSDLFAVGIVMYELLVGTRPFKGRDQAEVFDRICAGKYERPSGISAQLASIFEKALAKNPKNRFPSAGAFASELLRYQLDNGLQNRSDDVSELVEEGLGILT